MKSDTLLDAIGDAREEYVNDVRNYQPRRRLKIKRFFQRPAAIAACLAVILTLAIPVSAEIINGYVSNLLAPLYGNAKTEIVDQIGRPINASATVGNYTITADAVIGDRYNMAIVYSLTRTDGGQLEKGLSFEDYNNTAKRGTWGGSYSFHLSDDKRVLQIVEEWTAANRLRLNRSATVTFTNLMLYNEDTEEKVLLEEGTWELKFTIRYEDSSVKIPDDDVVFNDTQGNEYTVHNIIISPIGVHLDLTGPNWTKFFSPEEFPMKYITMSLVLQNGDVITIDDKNLESHGDLEDDRHRANLGATFENPIPLDQMKELVICGTSFSLFD